MGEIVIAEKVGTTIETSHGKATYSHTELENKSGVWDDSRVVNGLECWWVEVDD